MVAMKEILEDLHAQQPVMKFDSPSSTTISTSEINRHYTNPHILELVSRSNMAHPRNLFVFLLVSHLSLVMSYTSSLLCKNSCEEELKLSLYLHQISSGVNHNQEVIVNSTFPRGFGTTAVSDWPLLDAPASNAIVVARARGLLTQASQQGGFSWFSPFSMVFQADSRYNMSTLLVMGMFGPEPTGEWAIVGGTGKLAMARGIINYKASQMVTTVENYRQIDIQAFYIPNTV
uniref:Uncharacterized protein n=1 Tax=Avena sativa TaxID=4498 RepID=A0ACD5TQU6_AVESA